MAFYNFLLAFVICAVAFVIGELVATATKAWIPSVFVTAVLMLIGYWTILPHDLITDAGLIPFGSTLGVYLLVAHMGTVISLKQLIEQWKTVTVVLTGLAGMVLLGWFVAPLLIDKTLMIAGLPPLTGGIVAATTMQTAATEKGLELAALFAIAMYCIQGFAGYPLTALCLQREGKKLLRQWRSGTLTFTEEEKMEMANVGMSVIPDDSDVKKLIPKIPDKWNTPVLMLLKLGLIAYASMLLGQITPLAGTI